jgi:hypothetical protein
MGGFTLPTEKGGAGLVSLIEITSKASAADCAVEILVAKQRAVMRMYRIMC